METNSIQHKILSDKLLFLAINQLSHFLIVYILFKNEVFLHCQLR